MKKVLIILTFISIIVLLFWFGIEVIRTINSLDEIGKPLFEKKIIKFQNKKTEIYLKSKNWGLTGDHKISVISTNPDKEFQPDSISEYIFKGFEEIIYSVEKDTLKIFARHLPTIPKKFDSEIQIKVMKVENNIEWNKIKEKTKKSYETFE
ncbi:hypothetical protein FIA58_017695 [Flavobacterium jejuense]|uniref:Uncharacterized protein n=1 Tax=Flavobacterium jejuense TaxID=1544455 RepID=A0ABX0IUF8_9FLAO|nr:hypothetical protein [Flavobacterium jejuense]NHN27517.1 hypothetical protein [Flavobacterium jejuense]